MKRIIATEAGIVAQRQRVAEVKRIVAGLETNDARDLVALADALVRKSVWLVGGDGWAYDIGFGGLDHVLGSGMNVNVLVLDTEVYSNTGGQMSKSTPRGAVAKFASGGKQTGKKDLAMEAISYGSVYVARVAMGGNDAHTVRAFLEAEAHDGPSLIIAYSNCIAHGYDMAFGMNQQKNAVLSGYWPLMRYNPALRKEGKNPFQLDSKAPSIPLKQYAYQEARYTMLARSNPEAARELLRMAQEDVTRQWRVYANRAAMPGAGDSGRRTEETPHRCRGKRRQAVIDLTTTYLGLALKNPIVASASPLCDSLDKIRLLEDHSDRGGRVALAVRGATRSGRRNPRRRPVSGRRELRRIARLLSRPRDLQPWARRLPRSDSQSASASVAIPIIGSLNGVSAGGWIRYRARDRAGRRRRPRTESLLDRH